MKKKETPRDESIYKNFLETFGEQTQYLFVFEEMSELTKALTKFIRKRENASETEKQKLIDDIAEEIADVEVATEEIKFMFNLWDKVKEVKEFKIARGKERVKQKNMNLDVERKKK